MLTPELITFLLLCHDIHQIVVHEARMRVVVLGVQFGRSMKDKIIQIGITTTKIFNRIGKFQSNKT